MKKQRKSKKIHLKITPVVSMGLLSLASCNSFDESRLVCIDTTQNNRIVNKQFCKSIEENVDRQLKECHQRNYYENQIDACCKKVEQDAKQMKHPYAWYYMEKSVSDYSGSSYGPDTSFVSYYHQGYIHPSVMYNHGQVSPVAHPNSTVSRSGFISKSGGYASVSRGGFGGRSGSS